MPPRSRRPRSRRSQATPARRVAVLYARVSSKDQEREGFSIPAQQRLLREYAERNGMLIVEEYIDVETAKRAGRTAFDKMVAWLRSNRGSCNTILVEKTDRLYRNLKDYVLLDEVNPEIHFVKEGEVISEDSRSAQKFIHGIRVLMAKNYVDNLSEEVTKGMMEKARSGLWPSRAPLGYRNVQAEDGKRIMIPDPERAPLVRAMFEWVARGDRSLSQATQRANEAGLRMRKSGRKVGKATVHRILHNPLYCGDVVWQGELTPGLHTPIVSRDLWDRVQEALDDRNRNQRGKSRIHEFAFSGLMSCAHCGCALSGQIQKERYIYYHCTGFKGDCGEPYVREEAIAEHFARQIRRLQLPEHVRAWLKEGLRTSQAAQARYHADSVARLEAECAKLQNRIQQAYLDKLDGAIDSAFFEQVSETWRAEQRDLRHQIAKHEQADASCLEQGLALLELGQKAAELFDVADQRERRELLNFLVSNSTWGDGELKIEWRKPYSFLAEFTEAQTSDTPSEGTSEGVSSRMAIPTGFEPVLPG